MSEHTPDTEEVAFYYEGPDFNAGERRAAFDRWLAAELAAAERRGAIRALREAAEWFNSPLPDGTGNGRPYNSYRVAWMLEDRVEREEGE